MISILCEKHEKIKYSKILFELLNIDNSYKSTSIIIFSILDFNFENKTVSGNLITQNKISPLTIQAPNVIYNFAKQKERVDKNKIKLLMKQTDIIVKNEVNCFKQDMIMNMLLSESETKGFVLTNTSKQNNYGPIFTLYAIRANNGKWNSLNETTSVFYTPTLKIAECISNFIPSLTFCTIKFIINKDNSPFLMGFSGWNSSLLFEEQQFSLLSKFAKYFFSYSNPLNHFRRK